MTRDAIEDSINDVGDEEVVKKKKNKRELERDQEIRDIEKMLEVPGARMFFWRLLNEGRFQDSLSHPDPYVMMIRSGKRDMTLWVLAEIEEAVPGILLQMKEDVASKEKK